MPHLKYTYYSSVSMQVKLGSYSVQTNQGKKVDSKLKVGWSNFKIEECIFFLLSYRDIIRIDRNNPNKKVIFTIVTLG